jgi:hypothetical protein
MHEASLHEVNCFITLTYDEANLPEYGQLVYDDFQYFMRKLRKAHLPSKLRFYMCGEYGELNDRPHFHACLFGIDFPDKIYYQGRDENKVYTSAVLTEIWGKGLAVIGDLTFQSAGYVARYCLKKMNGDYAKGYYERVDPDTGEIFSKNPEFGHMSLKPGIGAEWLRLYWRDIYTEAGKGQVVVNGVQCSPPKFYDKKAKHLLAFEGISYNRYLNGQKRYEDNTDERLLVKEEVQRARVRMLKRNV